MDPDGLTESKDPEAESAVNEVRSDRIYYHLTIGGEPVARFQMPYLSIGVWLTRGARDFLLKNHPIYTYRNWQLVSFRIGVRLEEAIPLSEANCKNFRANPARSEAFARLC